MLKYFGFPSQTYSGYFFSKKEDVVKEINEYVEKNNLKITQIYSCDDNGLFVVFEKLQTNICNQTYNNAIDDFAKILKPLLNEKIKGWTNSENLERWCENLINKVVEELKVDVY